MKCIMKRAASLILAATLVVTGIYCGGTDAQAAKKPKKITMNKSSVNLKVGGKFKLKVKKVTPKKASTAVTYKISKKKDKKVASVTKKGVITAKKVGKATITVTSKKNKKAKAKVTVTVRKADPTPSKEPVVSATPVVSTEPTKAPDTTTDTPATNAPTSTPPKTTRTPATEAPPTAEPTPPSDMLDHASPPYTLEFNEKTIELQGGRADNNSKGSAYVINKDGSVTISNNNQYCGVAFILPDEQTENNFDTVTVTYKDVKSVGAGYGCGLWRAKGATSDDKNTEVVMSYDGVFASKDEAGNPITEGEYVATIKDHDQATKAYYVNKILLFHNDTSVHDLADSATVTITKIVFSHSGYTGENPPENTKAPATPKPMPESCDYSATKISTPVTIDGIEDEVWADVPELPIANKILRNANGEKSDTTATAKIAWDDDNLYGFVKVKDSEIDATASDDYLRDGIEFFLDEDYSMNKDFANNKDAFQYRFTGFEKDENEEAKEAKTHEIKGGSDDAKAAYSGIETAYTFTEDGYIAEFKIPFTGDRKAGDFVGFDIIVQDCSTDTNKNAEIYLRKTNTTALNYYDLSDVFGTLMLKDTDFVAAKISTPATIDGVVDEVWKNVPAFSISSRVLTRDPGDSTTTATAQVAWDDNNLYGLVKVKDENIDATAGNDYERDGVEFFLDEDNSKETGWANNKDAFQYRFTGLGKNEEDGTVQAALTKAIVNGGADAKPENPDDTSVYKGIETAYTFTDDGYVVEFKIPFANAKKDGDIVGFDIIVQDCKNSGRDAEIYFRDTKKGLSYWNLSDVFAELKLVDYNAQAEEE